MNFKTKQEELIKLCWHLMLLGLLAVAASLLLPVVAHAGTTGGSDPLGDVYNTLTTWTQGNVGKTIGLVLLLAGIGSAIKQSFSGVAVGIGGSMLLYYAPTIIDTIFNATLTPGMLN